MFIQLKSAKIVPKLYGVLINMPKHKVLMYIQKICILRQLCYSRHFCVLQLFIILRNINCISVHLCTPFGGTTQIRFTISRNSCQSQTCKFYQTSCSLRKFVDRHVHKKCTICIVIAAIIIICVTVSMNKYDKLIKLIICLSMMYGSFSNCIDFELPK